LCRKGRQCICRATAGLRQSFQTARQAGVPFYPAGVLIAFHKPYGVLSQFTADGSPNCPLAGFGFPKNVYAIGRLDADSEGLLLLSDEPEWNRKLLEPRCAHEREYWVQVERIPTPEALAQLAAGLLIQGRKTLPCRAWLLEPQPQIVGDDVTSLDFTNQKIETTPAAGRDAFHRVPGSFGSESDALERDPTKIPPRNPPIRFRKSVPDAWIGLELVEGRNRQVRRMTAAIGHPTLRLLRVRIGRLTLDNLPSGQWRVLSPSERKLAAGE
jgi:23S rRNA pseudouridine2457 synthase